MKLKTAYNDKELILTQNLNQLDPYHFFIATTNKCHIY